MAGTGDAQLVERILADPQDGWAAAWERYGHPLHTFCLRMLDDTAEADDAVADVFVVAAQRIDQLRQPDAFRAWLYAIARRRVQRRWRDRTRTAPVDPHGDVMTGTAVLDHDPGGSGDAAELLGAASAGLNDRDRELLALTLGADLDTTEVARITGETQNAVSVRVSRLKDTVGRAAGALLVARHHRRDCDILDQLLDRWDGTFDTVWRKRISRHVESCDDCGERRNVATSVFAAPLLLAAPSAALRDRVMEPISASRPATSPATTGTVAPDLGPWDDDGFPTTTTGRRWLPIALTVAAAVVVIATVIGLSRSGDDSQVSAAAEDEAPTSTSTTIISTTTEAEPDDADPIEDLEDDEAPQHDDPSGDDQVTGTTVPPAAPPEGDSGTVGNPTTTTTTTTTSAPAAPRVTIAVSPPSLEVGPPSTTIVTVDVTAPAGGASTVVSWDGPDASSIIVNGQGTHSETIGPFTGVPPTPSGAPSPTGSGPITITATTTDALGRTHTATATLTVSAVPG